MGAGAECLILPRHLSIDHPGVARDAPLRVVGRGDGHQRPCVGGRDVGWGVGVKFLCPHSPSSGNEGYVIWVRMLSA